MEMSRQERIELHDRYVAKLEGVRQSLMARFPEVLSVDLGLKRSHDKLTEQLSWRIFVKEKKRDADLAPEHRLPREIEGLPTDVHTREVGAFDVDPIPDESSYSSLIGGIQISSSIGGGTLGCFVNVVGDPKVYLMSNHHVLVGYEGSLGGLVGQPGMACDLCCCKCCDVATVSAGSGMAVTPPVGVPNTVDAAIAVLKGQNPGDTTITPYTNSIVDIGPIFGSATAVFGDTVRKRGRTTLLTQGTVVSTTYSDTIPLDDTHSAVFTDCVHIDPLAPTTKWRGKGDSGAAVVNSLGQVIGLHFFGLGNSGSACKIANIASRLNITVISTGTAGTVPHSGYVLEAPMPVAHPATFLQQIEQKIKGAAGGDKFLHAVHENRREVLDLINDHREVKVAWNRFQGPAFVGHLAKNVTEPAHRVPKEVNGYTLQHLLIKMSDVLERNGSRALARAVEEYSAVAFDFADQYEGFDSIDTLIQRANLCPNCGQPQTLNRHAE